MRTRLIQIGNSKGIRLSKTLIEEFDLKEEIIIEPTDKGILISSGSTTRQDWEEQFKAAAKRFGKPDPWNTISNKFDEEEWTW
jgi:antitoxin MazE